MTSIAYFSAEVLGVLIILILLYANIFELKQHSKKRIIFILLLIENLIVVTSDAITYLDLNWESALFIFGMLIFFTYFFPCLILITFSRYLYVHISEKVKINSTPFIIQVSLSSLVGLVTIVFLFTGKLFSVDNGEFVSGSLEPVYYILYLLCSMMFVVIIILHNKKLGLHDLLGALSFCFFPILSIIFTIFNLDFNIVVMSMPINLLVIYIILQLDNENTLIYQSNNDELTGLLNRRAYEEELIKYQGVPKEEDFVFASVDVNGLKHINDALGHLAGDELIKGAADCLNITLGNYGHIFRTGGDEFAALFFANSEKLNHLLKDLNNSVSRWRGHYAKSLSISIGVATKKEFPNDTIKELSKIADNRMYIDKEQYYMNKGVDRNGQNEAYSVLCSLYTKILRINITNDTFNVVNMNLAEQTIEKGFANKISSWLEGFGKMGNVHPDDLEEYLSKTNLDYMKDYFKRGKTSLSLIYRRKYGDDFKQVMMEIIPANDYTDENQSLFLYVKNIDI